MAAEVHLCRSILKLFQTSAQIVVFILKVSEYTSVLAHGVLL